MRFALAYNADSGTSRVLTLRKASTSAYVRLAKGDTVYVGSCAGWENIRKSYTFHFIGALITAS